jgi:hypothetical protein
MVHPRYGHAVGLRVLIAHGPLFILQWCGNETRLAVLYVRAKTPQAGASGGGYQAVIALE